MNYQRDFFEAYVKDRRLQEIELFRLEDLGYVIRYTPNSETDGLVVFCRATRQKIDSVIREQIQYFDALRTNFEWKVYEFDEPSNLEELLTKHGFSSDEAEVFMVYPIGDELIPSVTPKTCDIVRITNRQGVVDVVSVQEKVWGRQFEWLSAQLMANLAKDPSSISIYCAYIDGVPVGTGWTDYPNRSVFPELHGGAVVPELRGQGIYKALYALRIEEAAHRGFKNMVVDASPMSRPILENLGFIHVCNTTPMKYEIA